MGTRELFHVLAGAGLTVEAIGRSAARKSLYLLHGIHAIGAALAERLH